MTIKQTVKDGVAFLEQTIEELTKERDYLDARCAALENDLVLDDVVSKLENVQTRRLADFENHGTGILWSIKHRIIFAGCTLK